MQIYERRRNFLHKKPKSPTPIWLPFHCVHFMRGERGCGRWDLMLTVLEHEYCRRDVMWIHSLSRVDGFSPSSPSSFGGWSRDRAESSEVNKKKEMHCSWSYRTLISPKRILNVDLSYDQLGKSLYRPGLMPLIKEIHSTILVTPVTKNPMLWSMTSSSILCFSRHFRWTRAFHVSVW